MIWMQNDELKKKRMEELQNFVDSFRKKFYSYKNHPAYFEIDGTRIKLMNAELIEKIYNSLSNELYSLRSYFQHK